MDKKSKELILILVILIVAVAVYLYSTYEKDSKENEQQNSTYVANEVKKNEIVQNKVEKISEKVEEKVPEEPTPEPVKEENNKKNEEKAPENSEIQSNNDEEKAISMAKKDWGNTSGVSFDVTSCNADGSYTVRVRDEKSVVVEWYKVYPKTGKCIRGEY